MTAEELDLLRAYISAATSMAPPTAKLLVSAEDRNEREATCYGCQAVIRLPDMPTRHSGLYGYKDLICFKCQKEAKKSKLVRIVCARCLRMKRRNAIRAMLYPARDEDGFVFEPGATYHLTHCPACAPGTTQSPIAERVLWLRKNNLPLPPALAQVATTA
jgi:hypothetical protein